MPVADTLTVPCLIVNPPENELLPLLKVRVPPPDFVRLPVPLIRPLTVVLPVVPSTVRAFAFVFTVPLIVSRLLELFLQV